jgi:hypothetical protein
LYERRGVLRMLRTRCARFIAPPGACWGCCCCAACSQHRRRESRQGQQSTCVLLLTDRYSSGPSSGQLQPPLNSSHDLKVVMVKTNCALITAAALQPQRER